MRSLSIIAYFAATACLFIFSTSLTAQLPDPAELNTAANGISTTFPVGALDTNWYVAYGDDDGPISAFVPATVVGSCSGFWYTSPFPNVDWISYNFNNPGEGPCTHEVQGCTDLFFRREINLPATTDCGQPIAEGFCLGLDFYADNAVYEIWVNDVSNYQYDLPDDPYDYVGYVDPTSINLCDGWQEGTNVLMVQTKSCPSSQGFLAQASLVIDEDFFFPFEVDTSICAGESFAGYTDTGLYVDTLFSADGCDSIRTLILTVLPNAASDLEVSICAGQAYEGYTDTGLFVDTLTAANGCDSVRTLNLTVLPVATAALEVSICTGESFAGYADTGVYIDTLVAANGCDSIRTLDLTVLPAAASELTVGICEGETYEGYTMSGTYVDTLTATNGCDSIRTLNLTVQPVAVTQQSAAICGGETYEGYATTGVFTDTLSSQFGCDSIRILELTVFAPETTQLAVGICEGETHEGYGVSGIYTDTLTAQNGCDSIRTLELTVSSSVTSTLFADICSGESYEGYTLPGIYTDTLQTQNGCDSIRILDLEVLDSYETETKLTLCAGTEYDFNGRLITEPGRYTDTLLTMAGCDSIVTLEVDIAADDFLGEDLVLCTDRSITLTGPSEETLWFDGRRARSIVISHTGSYWASFTDLNGCEVVDSVFVQYNTRSFVPNIFSPNRDGINDFFAPFFSDINFSDYQLRVFDRWGGLVFSTKHPEERWDGTARGEDCRPGVYLYVVTYENETCGEAMLSGEVNLIR